MQWEFCASRGHTGSQEEKEVGQMLCLKWPSSPPPRNGGSIVISGQPHSWGFLEMGCWPWELSRGGPTVRAAEERGFKHPLPVPGCPAVTGASPGTSSPHLWGAGGKLLQQPRRSSSVLALGMSSTLSSLALLPPRALLWVSLVFFGGWGLCPQMLF